MRARKFIVEVDVTVSVPMSVEAASAEQALGLVRRQMTWHHVLDNPETTVVAMDPHTATEVS